MTTYALKIRGGRVMDKNGKKAGKGPLVAEDISHTIGTVQDQYIFEPIVGFDAYNLAATGDVTMTLSARSSDAHHVPVICIQGNVIDRSEHAGANGAGWKIDTCYTLNTIDRPAVVYRVKENDHHK